jgi:shikimate dehydrogenase
VTGWPGRLVLLGHPLGHSLSPAVQNAALRAAGIPLVYELADTPRSALDETLRALRRDRAAGNVTIPYKEAVAGRCDRLTDPARRTGAVNTFWTAVDGALVGDNTDVDGFLAAVRALGLAAPASRVAVLGAGGAAAAVLEATKGWQLESIRLYARTPGRGRALLERLKVAGTVVESAASAAENATLLVNATPLGMKEDESPVPVTAIPAGCAVLDLVYRPGETTLVRQARARGLPAADGLTMLVEQGAAAFERWFGQQPDREAMWSAVPRSR